MSQSNYERYLSILQKGKQKEASITLDSAKLDSTADNQANQTVDPTKLEF
jgi:hypothetical protein